MASTDGWHYEYPWDTTIPPDYRNDNTMWVSHVTGNARPIKDLDDNHLKRAIQMLSRGYDSSGMIVPQWCNTKYDYLLKELASRKLEVIEDGWDE